MQTSSDHQGLQGPGLAHLQAVPLHHAKLGPRLRLQPPAQRSGAQHSTAQQGAAHYGTCEAMPMRGQAPEAGRPLLPLRLAASG